MTSYQPSHVWIEFQLGDLGGIQALSALAPYVLPEMNAVTYICDSNQFLTVLSNSRVEVTHKLEILKEKQCVISLGIWVH